MDIGLTLKNKRKQLNYSLEKVHRETKISLKFLDGLENNNYTVFPAELYMVGSIKKYCAYLGIDDSPLLENLRRESKPQKTAGSAGAADPAKSRSEEPLEEQNENVVRDDLIKGFFIFALIIGTIAVFLYLFGFYTSTVYQSNKNRMDSLFSKTPFISSQFMDSFDLPERLQLKARAVERVWIQLKDQNALLYEGFLDGGRELDFTTHTFFKIFAENPLLVEMKLNSFEVDNKEIFPESVKTANLTKEYFKELRRAATLRAPAKR